MIHICLTFSCWWLLLLPFLGMGFLAFLENLGVDDDFTQPGILLCWLLFLLLLVGLAGYSIGHA
jgi:hypothetical protein